VVQRGSGPGGGHLCVVCKTFDTIGAKAKQAIILTGTLGHTSPSIIDTNWEGMVRKMFGTVGEKSCYTSEIWYQGI
jgi:hypothetical protein